MTVLTDEEKAAETELEDKTEEGKKPEDLLYPKADEEKPAEEEKTEEELALEKKAEEDKLAKEKADSDKRTEEGKKTEIEGLVKAEDLQLPEGIKVNDDIQEKFLALVNDKDMKPAEKAQAMIALQQDLYAAQAEAHQEQKVQWEKEVAEDKEIIGDIGDKMDENLAIAKKGMEALNVDGLSKLLLDTGFGSHPLIVKAFFRIGKTVSEDSFRFGSKGGSAEKKTAADILYPNQK